MNPVTVCARVLPDWSALARSHAALWARAPAVLAARAGAARRAQPHHPACGVPPGRVPQPQRGAPAPLFTRRSAGPAQSRYGRTPLAKTQATTERVEIETARCVQSEGDGCLLYGYQRGIPLRCRRLASGPRRPARDLVSQRQAPSPAPPSPIRGSHRTGGGAAVRMRAQKLQRSHAPIHGGYGGTAPTSGLSTAAGARHARLRRRKKRPLLTPRKKRKR